MPRQRSLAAVTLPTAVTCGSLTTPRHCHGVKRQRSFLVPLSLLSPGIWFRKALPLEGIIVFSGFQ